jgi:hypothetical protein
MKMEFNHGNLLILKIPVQTMRQLFWNTFPNLQNPFRKFQNLPQNICNEKSLFSKLLSWMN